MMDYVDAGVGGVGFTIFCASNNVGWAVG